MPGRIKQTPPGGGDGGGSGLLEVLLKRSPPGF